MSNEDGFYSASARRLQSEQDSQALADALLKVNVSDRLDEKQVSFVSRSDFFFIASVNADGEPTVSYKGGSPGFVHVVDPQRLIFPNYDGNGMFMTMGNLVESKKVGLLFIDFETPNRLRVQGTATVSKAVDLMAHFPGANMVVEVAVSATFNNCARYIHRHQRQDSSQYVPDEGGQQPFPAWKRIDAIQPFLPRRDQGKADKHGGTITEKEYGQMLRKGTS
jgi:uncharacterized protein